MADPWGTLESIATIIALCFAGIWTYLLFVKKRLGNTRLKPQHDLTAAKIDSERVLLRVTLSLENVGHVLARVERAETWVQQMLPVSESVSDHLSASSGKNTGTERELPWPVIGDREDAWEEDKFVIEPGESDQIDYDFVVEGPLDLVTVYSFIPNPDGAEGVGWSATTVFEVRSPATGDQSQVESVERKGEQTMAQRQGVKKKVHEQRVRKIKPEGGGSKQRSKDAKPSRGSGGSGGSNGSND